MSHAVEMPALDGRSPLGFLAALGLLNLLASPLPTEPRLSFSDHGTAVIHSNFAAPSEVAKTLQDLVAAADQDATIAGIDPRFPLRAGSGADPMRRPREGYRQLAQDIQDIDPRAAGQWLPSLLTDLAADSQGRAGLTPFNAPSGQQKLFTFFEKPFNHVKANPDCIGQALTSWRRAGKFTGEYLDHHAINSAADDPLGRTGAESGVPGATWLATMALPLLRLTGDGNNVAATLWYRTGRRSVMLWPLWNQPLDIPAVQTLLEHPCLTPADPEPTISHAQWPTLGIIGVYGAERQHIHGRKFPGVLAPIRVATLQ